MLRQNLGVVRKFINFRGRPRSDFIQNHDLYDINRDVDEPL